MSDPFQTVPSELPRDRWGRPLITPPYGGDPVAYTRVTTFVGALEDTYHLSMWSQRMVALGMARAPWLVTAASAITDPKDKHQKRNLDGIAKQAREVAGGGAAAATGTALHSMTEQIDSGHEPQNVPEAHLADLEVYRKIMRYFRPVKMEGFTVNDELQVGGSYDRVLEVTQDGLDAFFYDYARDMTLPDGRRVCPGDHFIGDLKTGNTEFGIGKIAMQLGVYANSKDYDHTLGTRTDLPGNPSKDWGIVIALPAGTGQVELKWVDLASGYEAARDLAREVHAWRKRRDLSHTFAATSVAPVLAPNLLEQISTAESRDALLLLHELNKARWTPGLTSAAKARIAELGA